VLDAIANLPPEAWLVPPVVILLAIGLGVWVQRRRDLSRCRRIADRLGLRLEPGAVVNAPEIVGEYAGRRLSMVTVSNQRARRRIRRPWTRVSVDVTNPESIQLRLRPQDFLDTILTKVGLPDIKVGDTAFDRRYLVHGDEPELAKAVWLDQSLRDAFIATRVDSAELSGSRLHVYYARVEKDVEHAVRLCDASVRLAERIDALKRDTRPEILS
jgi:hypothetical protein